jgi:tol-pal system protein YbgF
MKKMPFIILGVALTLGAPTAFAQQDQDQDNNFQQQPGAAGDEMRFEQLGDQMRQMTGRIEELQHQVESLQSRMDKLSGDVDMRLQGLEQGNGGPPRPNNAMNEPRSLRSEPPMSPPPPSADEGQTAMNDAPQMADPGMLPSGSPQQQYDYAFGLLRDANYPAAERALRDFVRRYPDNRLSSNAQYWLGETYFVRHNYQAAAAAFAQGYQRFPKGPKAPEALLKLGSSLTMLGRSADACRSFAQLDREFPIAPANLKAKEAEERHKAQCR